MKFVAEDGKVFETMEECKEYEEQNIAEMLVGNIPHYIIDADDLFGGSSCNLYVFFRIGNSEQDKRFKKWVIDGGCVDNAISCIVCSDFADDDGEIYAIPLDEEDRRIVWKILDNKLRKYSWEQKSCKELLAEAREWIKEEFELE